MGGRELRRRVRMLKRVAMAMVAALAVGAAASAQTSGLRRARRHRLRRDTGASSRPGPIQTLAMYGRRRPLRWGHRSVVRTDRRDPSREALVGQRLSRQLRPPTGLHRRVELAGDVRLRPERPRRDLRRVDARAPHRPRRAADLPSGQPQRRRPGQRVPVRHGRAGRTTSSATSGSAARSTSCPSGSRSRWRSPLRGMVKLPTAKDDEEGVGTGKTDFPFDFIASKEINQRVELSGYGGFIFRGDPDEVDLSDGFRWGFGAGVPDAQGPAGHGRTARRDRSSTMSSTRASDRTAHRRRRLVAAARLRRRSRRRTSRSA